MSSSIKGGGNAGGTGNVNSQPTLQSKEGQEAFRKATLQGKGSEQAAVPRQVVDGFVRASITPAMAAIAQKITAQSINFSSLAWAQLAGMFAAVLQQHPGASRKKRAKLFAKTVLRHRKFSNIFDDEEDEEQLEEMFDAIADQLERVPVLAQMVDDVTEASKKIKLSEFT